MRSEESYNGRVIKETKKGRKRNGGMQCIEGCRKGRRVKGRIGERKRKVDEREEEEEEERWTTLVASTSKSISALAAGVIS
jgi:hypothetical protein